MRSSTDVNRVEREQRKQQNKRRNPVEPTASSFNRSMWPVGEAMGDEEEVINPELDARIDSLVEKALQKHLLPPLLAQLSKGKEPTTIPSGGK